MRHPPEPEEQLAGELDDRSVGGRGGCHVEILAQLLRYANYLCYKLWNEPTTSGVTSRAQRRTDGDTMSIATRPDTQSPALQVADTHDLIRVHGARENNLKDLSVEMPKRRLTVFTGVSGS